MSNPHPGSKSHTPPNYTQLQLSLWVQSNSRSSVAEEAVYVAESVYVAEEAVYVAEKAVYVAWATYIAEAV